MQLVIAHQSSYTIHKQSLTISNLKLVLHTHEASDKNRELQNVDLLLDLESWKNLKKISASRNFSCEKVEKDFFFLNFIYVYI